MNYIIVTINTIEYPFTADSVDRVPLFEGHDGVSVSATVPFEVEFRHIAVLSKILRKARVAPMLDLNSHIDVLLFVRMAKYLGLSTESIVDGFSGWVENVRWIDLWCPEYMYLVYLEAEELVDFRKFFRSGKNPFEMVKKAAGLAGVRANPETYIEMLIFFKNFKFELCFDENNAGVQSKIEALKKDREDTWETFLVNPHEEFMQGYFKHTPNNYDVWSCEGISCVHTPEVGDVTLAPFNVAMDRVREFTHGLMDKPLNNAADEFPFDNVVFAGGSISKLLAAVYNPKNARQSDWDMFVCGKTFAERSKNFEAIINWFNTYKPDRVSKTYYALRGSVTTVYVMDVARKFQIISSNRDNPYTEVDRFDLSHIQWCLWKGQFRGTPEACKAMKERVTRFSNIGRLRTNRLIKALHCGYSIYKEASIIENHIDITQIIEPVIEDDKPVQSMQLQKLIRDLYGFYYPRSDDQMDDYELRQHILCMIEKDANANLVTDDPAFVLNNVTIGGNFDDGYEAISYNTFNISTVINRALARGVRNVTLRNKRGFIRLTTSILKVVNVISNDMGLEIIATPSEDEFRDFCGILEGPVYRMFNRNAVTQRIISDAGTLKFNMPRFRLDRQNVLGVSCLRNQRGMALNIEEELKPGDDVQVLFTIELVMFPEQKLVNLQPVKFVKYCKYDPEDVVRVAAEDGHLEEEIERLAAESDFAGEIVYEDELDANK